MWVFAPYLLAVSVLFYPCGDPPTEEPVVDGRHWAFNAPERSPLPTVVREDWARDGLDVFVLGRLERGGLEPAAPAPRGTWLRRVSLGLTGLPPTPEEMDAFFDDSSAGARGRVVDRLLQSPRYGEHMASDWLDLARYADTYGYQSDVYCEVWPWRDWVIGAFNDRFDAVRMKAVRDDCLCSDAFDNGSRDRRIPATERYKDTVPRLDVLAGLRERIEKSRGIPIDRALDRDADELAGDQRRCEEIAHASSVRLGFQPTSPIGVCG